MAAPLDITPETRVGALLDAYPHLEEVLIAQAPVFAKLRNPVLRRTVAKVATLEKAAQLAGLPPRDLVQTLRKAAGLDSDKADPAAAHCASCSGHVASADAPADPPPPEWLAHVQVRETIDADAVIAAGESPLTGVLRHARALEPGSAIRVVSSFRPFPLLDVLEKQGFLVDCRRGEPGRFETVISRKVV